MKAEVKTQWLTALRSGQYQQGEQRLRLSDDTYCCLGVLCDLAVKAGVIEEPRQEFSDGNYLYGASGNAAFLPSEVAKWADVDRFGQYGDNGEVSHDLAKMNDDGRSFHDIADVIEAHF